MFSFEIEQRESGFYSERADRQTESSSHPVAYYKIDMYIHIYYTYTIHLLYISFHTYLVPGAMHPASSIQRV